jgi:membrane protease subunit HflC
VIPFIQNIYRFDKRLQDYDTNPKDVITLDKKALRVDYYAKWRIINPKAFFEAVVDNYGAEARLDEIIYSELRVEFGKHTLHNIVSEQRQIIMDRVRDRAHQQLEGNGIAVVDVRIKAADLPKENEEAVYNRMITERERVAKLYRSEGEKKARKIRAAAEREQIEILAEANKKAEEIMGQGDKIAIKTYADTYSKDPEFYAFYRSLEAYKKSLNKNVTLYLTPESSFLNYFQNFKQITN